MPSSPSFLEAVLHALRKYRFPSFSQWLKLPRALKKKEKVGIAVLSVAFGGSLLFLFSGIYLEHTMPAPSRGGSMTEGMVGSPRFLNPLYAETNDVDRGLVQLLFSGILRHDKKGNLVSDLARDYLVQEGAKVYEVNLREDVRWHDGFSFSADDVLFTIQTVQDPRYKSPVRANWVGVSVEKVSPFKVRFVLKEPFAGFPERLTLKILPKHLWEEISPENFALSTLNLQPVGTGPFRLVDLKRESSGGIKEITLKAHTKYHLEGPFLETLAFRFFANQQDLLNEAEAGKLQSFSLTSPATQRFRNPSLKTYSFPLPRAYALFFNLEAKDSPVAESGAREALDLSVDRNSLNEEVFEGQAMPLSSPLRPDLFSFEVPPLPGKNIDLALQILEQEGYQKTNEGKLVAVRAPSGDFTQDMRRGSQGPSVITLQECLARDKEVYPLGTVNGVFGPSTQAAVTAFQEKYAPDILRPSGLTKGTGTVGPSTRAKLQELCSAPETAEEQITLKLTTLNQSPLTEVADFLAKSFGELGIATEVSLLSAGDLERDVIKPRNFEMLLFGEILGKTPDPLPFWHSSQKKDPGLNLASFQDKNADKLLEQIRRESDEEARGALLEQLQEILLKEVPALFLYDLPFQYVVAKEMKGIEEHILSDPSQRFSGAPEWYIKEKRVWTPF